MDSVYFGIDDLISALAYDFMTVGRDIDNALIHINGYIDREEYTDSFEIYMLDNFRYFSILLDSFNSVGLEEETKKSYLDLIGQLLEYQDDPDVNQNFKDEIFASVRKNPKIAAFAIYNRETEGIIEKEIISELISFSEGTSDFSYTKFNRAIKDFIDDKSWNGYHNFDWSHFNFNEKLEQMRSYGLLEYEDLFSKEGIIVTDLGRSVYDVLDYFHLNGKIELAPKKDELTSIISRMKETITGNDLMTTEADEIPEEIEPSVGSVDVEVSEISDVCEPVETGVDKPLEDKQDPEPDIDVPVPDSSLMQENADDSWHIDYKGREFPFAVRIHNGLDIALDEGRETVVKVLDYDCEISEEFLSLLCTSFASEYNVIVRKVRHNGNGKAFDDALRSLQQKELILKEGSGFVPGPDSYDAINYGLNLLMALNHKYTRRERDILEIISSKDNIMDKIGYI